MRMKRAEEEQYKKNLASALLKYKDCVSRLDVPKPEWFIKTFKLIRRGQYISNKRWHSIVGSNAETISYKQAIKKRNSYIIEELKSGINKDEITKKYNITHKQLSALIRKKSPPSEGSLKHADKVCSLYLEGTPVSSIEEIIGISIPTINKLLDTKKINRRSQSETSIQHHALRTDYFEEIDTAEKAWILGLIYADGSLNKRNSLQVSQSKENESLLRIIAEELNYPAKFTSSRKSHTEKKQSVLTITRETLNKSPKSAIIRPSSTA